MTQAELNKNAVKSIFAIDDAKAQLESFGSQLDLGLPPEEDFEPKGFAELMTVNPSTDPNYGDSSEKFADLGDDLQDEQTQKFVIDKFAEEVIKINCRLSIFNCITFFSNFIGIIYFVHNFSCHIIWNSISFC